MAASAAVALSATAAAQAAAGVTAARGSTRSALVHAFVAQDGSGAGIKGVYLSRSRPGLAVVCQRTPDAGTVRFIFQHSGRSWHYRLSTRSTSTGNSAERQLEHACG